MMTVMCMRLVCVDENVELDPEQLVAIPVAIEARHEERPRGGGRLAPRSSLPGSWRIFSAPGSYSGVT